MSLADRVRMCKKCGSTPSSFGFSSLGCHPRFYLSLIGCSFSFSSLGNRPRFYLSLFVCSFGFLSLGCHPRFYLISFVCPFGLSSLGRHLRFYLSLFFVHLVSHHWDAILGSISTYSVVPLVSHY